MELKKYMYYAKSIGLSVALCVVFNAKAQKMPKIQLNSKRAPIDIKIDGKTTEWNDQFQAYNPSNRIYYTVSNDDDNLYLTIRAADELSSEKAIFGITFTIKLPHEQGNSKKNVSVIFPINIEVQKRELIRNTINTTGHFKGDTSSTAKKKIDSLRKFANKKIDDVFKEIDVSGVEDKLDTSISIYNANGVKVAAQFDAHMRYTYELAVPLKYLDLSINSGQKFKYNIKMNGIPEKSPGSPYGPPVVYADGSNFMAPNAAFMMFATDFSGEYILAKKQ